MSTEQVSNGANPISPTGKDIQHGALSPKPQIILNLQKRFHDKLPRGNIEALVEEEKRDGVNVVFEIETFEYGKFVHILDIEGNKIELWEPDDSEYDKIVDGRTK